MKKQIKITEEQLKRLVENKNKQSIKENEEMENNYMFFTNLKQLSRQSQLLLNLDESKVNDILNNGHDWADDHITVAKENVSQVFDFMMNEFKGSHPEHEKFEPSKDFSLNEEGDMNETSVGAIELSIAKEIAPMIIEKLKEHVGDLSHLDMGILTRALHHELINHKEDFSDGMEDESMMNESVLKIKNEFKRFL